ncbi:MAG TPA: HD domain-containing phosphohydrolase [Stenomitos sp.]
MTTELRILLLEDVQTDAELALRALHKSGITPTSFRVDTRDDYLQALSQFQPDVILADYQLPSFDGLSALSIARERCPEVPFIFVTGKMGEEVAIETLQKGATDYILKDRLSRLGPAVLRALAEAREHQHTADLQAQLAAIVESASEGIIGMDLQGVVTSWNRGAEAIYGYRAAEMLGQSIERLSCPSCPHTMQDLIQEIRSGRRVRRNETQHATREGRILDVSLSLAPILDRIGRLVGISALALDITEQKQVEQALIENGKRLERSMRTTIQAIANIVEVRDPYTAGHQRRVAQLAEAIARELGLPEDQIQGLQLAGIVHDIGKIQIPAEILSKPGRLTAVEYQFIQLHSQAGFEILKDVEFPWPIAEIVGQHHERLNGSGYPKGLKDGEILLEAKILSVADVVEAMASHRPYRPGLGIDAALEEISNQRGLHFQPEIVDACVTLFRDKGYQLES